MYGIQPIWGLEKDLFIFVRLQISPVLNKKVISSSNKLIHIQCNYTYTCIHKHAYNHILEFICH
jgi:hypothetical protein